MRQSLPFAVVLLAAGCTPSPQPAATPLDIVSVRAKAETEPVATAEDAADDPAIWRNTLDPAKSLIIGTDKRAGIHVYDLNGRQLSFTPSPRLNNVDLRDNVTIAGQKAVLVAASDRADVANAKISLFRLDTAAGKLAPVVATPVGAGEAYGLCLWRRKGDGALYSFVVMKDGRIDQLALDLAGEKPGVQKVRSMKLSSQSEGCVVDDRTGILYVAEEDVGIWSFDADPKAPVKPKSFAKVEGKALVADVEGLALAPSGDRGGYLIASSQGDNAYTLYNLSDGKVAGRFRIEGSQSVDGTSETDGVELVLGDFGPSFKDGIFVAQDGDNAPETQNFKIASWGDVLKSIGLQ
jgi:myo-inositol-hexaphosphate 3-phosphohydrolase